jgi:hypothetical protein
MLPGVITSVSSKVVIPWVTSGRLPTASRAAARSAARSTSTAPEILPLFLKAYLPRT